MSAVRTLATWAVLCSLACASPAWSHAIAERYDLPVPLGFYVAGAVLIVAVTFLIAAAFIYAVPREGADRPLLPASWSASGAAVRRSAAIALKFIGIAVLLIVIATGLFGNQHPARNLAPTLVWIIWWCAFSILVACVGNLWPALNPWWAIHDFFRRASAKDAVSIRPYPDRLAEWPAVVLLLIFVWIELISPFSSSPKALAILAIAYSLLTLIGMYVFGARAWLERGEVFSLVFNVLSSFAPFGISFRTSPDGVSESAIAGDEKGVLVWRSWSAALFDVARPRSPAMISLVLLLLSSVLFDGLLGTGLWRTLEPSLPSDRGGLIAATYGLIGTWAIFLFAYLLTAVAMSRIICDGSTTSDIAGRYLLTLIPIAVGYNIAHNYSYIILQSQTFLALLSDPFGFGWNLFGTARWEPDLEAIDAREIWYVAIGAIVAGHVIAVYLAHIVALRTAPSHKLAIYSLIPMTVLMLLYTGASLSILAEPIVRFSVPDPSYS